MTTLLDALRDVRRQAGGWWTGIVSSHLECGYCSWAFRAGNLEIKRANARCPEHGGYALDLPDWQQS